MGQNGLTKDKLRENGIIFDVNLVTFETLSLEHAEAANVQQGLLDFENILTKSSLNRLDVTERSTIAARFPNSRIPPLPSHDLRSPLLVDRYNERYQVALQDAKFNRAQEIAVAAQDIVAAKEPRWVSLIKNRLFGHLIERARAAEGLQHCKAATVLETIRVEEEDVWNQGRKALQQTTPRSAPVLSAPKADLYLALPILPMSSKPRGFYKDNFIQNFHETRLARLCEEGLISCPVADLSGSKRLDQKRLLCFPSAVIEVKHHKAKPSETEFCYCQAANASSTAVAMLSMLSGYSSRSLSPQIIRPVVSFTFIGPEVKVWLTYASPRKPKNKRVLYEMRCIWQGSLRKVWDSMQLCCIIEHLHYWTVRHFRPWVSSCLDQWCLKYNVTGLADGEDIDTDGDNDDRSDDESDDRGSKKDGENSEEKDDEESKEENDEDSQEEDGDESEEQKGDSEKESDDEVEEKEDEKQKKMKMKKGKGKQEVDEPKPSRVPGDLAKSGIREPLLNEGSDKGKERQNCLDSPSSAHHRSTVDGRQTAATASCSDTDGLGSSNAPLSPNGTSSTIGPYESASSNEQPLMKSTFKTGSTIPSTQSSMFSSFKVFGSSSTRLSSNSSGSLFKPDELASSSEKLPTKATFKGVPKVLLPELSNYPPFNAFDSISTRPDPNSNSSSLKPHESASSDEESLTKPTFKKASEVSLSQSSTCPPSNEFGSSSTRSDPKPDSSSLEPHELKPSCEKMSMTPPPAKPSIFSLPQSSKSTPALPIRTKSSSDENKSANTSFSNAVVPPKDKVASSGYSFVFLSKSFQR